MTYKVQYDPRVHKDLEKLDGAVLKSVEQAIRTKLFTNPTVFGKPLRNPLAGLWSLRVGEYRVVYFLKGQNVQVLLIGIRSSAYEDVQKRLS